jgi:uncharacterized repeat protein (TIGR01451 family)
MGGWWGDTYDLYRLVGAVTEECVPYLGVGSDCIHDPCEIIANVNSWEEIDTTVVSLKTHLLANGPIPVGMVVYDDFAYYTGGCYEHEGHGIINHGVLLVGWDDTTCAGEGAWRIKNSWSTAWGESGFAWLKYGTCRIGVAATIIDYTPRGPAKMVVDGFMVDDASGDADGHADPGETITLPVTLLNVGRVTATGVSATIMSSTPGVSITTASATFGDIDPGNGVPSNPPHFGLSVGGAMLCGSRMKFSISVSCDQGTYADEFEIFVGDVDTLLVDDAEEDQGWSLVSPDDDFTDGRWRRKTPVGTFQDSMLIQPELDHTPAPLVKCFVTANTWRMSPPEAADVDGGKTTLTTPLLDLSPYADVDIRYWRWYSNHGGTAVDDVWVVDVSGDSGATWINLETLVASENQWTRKDFRLGDYIPLTGRALVRFVASDYGEESLVEAAVDDIVITGCSYTVDQDGPSVSVASPNGGEEMIENTDFEVRWTATDDYGIRQATVVASYDGGISFTDTLGVVGPFDTTLVWHAPGGEHPACKVGLYVIDRGYNSAFDESDSTFAIVKDLSGITDGAASRVPDGVELIGCEENPTAGRVTILFVVPRATNITISVYDVSGRLLRVIVQGMVEGGHHTATWNGEGASGMPASPGVYFIRLEAAGESLTSKVVLTR